MNIARAVKSNALLIWMPIDIYYGRQVCSRVSHEDCGMSNCVIHVNGFYCAKGDFPRVQYAFYLHAIDARHAVKCGIAAVT